MGGPPGSQQVPYPSNLPFRVVSKTIGSGAYASHVFHIVHAYCDADSRGRIRKATPHNQPTPVIAVKFINKEHAFKQGRLRPKQLQIEISLHKTICPHSNIIRYLSHGEDTHWVWMCMELAEGGDLFDKIEADVGCGEDVAHLYFTQLVNAISWCHGKGVAHRDIKPENMLLSLDGDLKLADFGLATQFFHVKTGERKKCGMVCGSPPYIAPEILEVGQTNAKRKQGEEKAGYDPQIADVWSCAIVVFVLLAGNTPWDEPNARTSREYYDYVHSSGRPSDELWDSIPHEALSLVRGLLRVNPAERFTFHDVHRHPWYTRSNAMLSKQGTVANPVNLATQMMEGLRIDFSKDISASQTARKQHQSRSTDAMDIDTPPRHLLEPGWTKFASTQPETPVADTPFDWEAPPRVGAGISASQPQTAHDVTSTDLPLVTREALLDALAEEPSMSQFSQIPISQMTATQHARRFADIMPSHSLARFVSHYTFSALLPLLSSALHRLNVPVAALSASALEGKEDIVSFRIKTLDARKELLQGNVVVERIQIGGFNQTEALEVRFIKAKGDPVGWRRLFKDVAVLCKDAIPRHGEQ